MLSTHRYSWCSASSSTLPAIGALRKVRPVQLCSVQVQPHDPSRASSIATAAAQILLCLSNPDSLPSWERPYCFLKPWQPYSTRWGARASGSCSFPPPATSSQAPALKRRFVLSTSQKEITSANCSPDIGPLWELPKPTRPLEPLHQYPQDKETPPGSFSNQSQVKAASQCLSALSGGPLLITSCFASGLCGRLGDSASLLGPSSKLCAHRAIPTPLPPTRQVVFQ